MSSSVAPRRTRCLMWPAALVLALAVGFKGEATRAELAQDLGVGSDVRGSSVWLNPASPHTIALNVDQLILTVAEFVPAFTRLATHRASQGVFAMVVSLDQVAALYPDARDLQEQIRLFLQDAYASWGTRSVLLGGGISILPTREIDTTGTTYEQYDASFVTDLYYGALDGDWDANGNGIFGEVFVSASLPGDYPDLVTELAVGRAPVRTLEESNVFVDKILTYESDANLESRGRAFAFAGVSSPSGYDLALFAEDWIQIGLTDSGSNLTVQRRYENPAAHPSALPLTLADLLEELNVGEYGLVMAPGPGGSSEQIFVPDGVFDSARALALQNSAALAVWITATTWSTDFQVGCIHQALLQNPDGGAVAAVGMTTLPYFGAIMWLGAELIAAAFGSEGATLGEALRTSRNLFVGDSGGGSWKQVQAMAWTLLGDPELRPIPQVPVAAPPGVAQQTRPISLGPAIPNPFNPHTSIFYSLATAGECELIVYDVAGRRVRTLVAGHVDAGQHEAHWDGRDEQGRRVASGVYLYRLVAAEFTETKRMVMVK